MSSYVEVRGKSLREQRDGEKRLHFLSIHRGNDGDNSFVVAHHHSDDEKPTYHRFQDGYAMLAHVAEHAGVSEPHREILPEEVTNLSGRGE